MSIGVEMEEKKYRFIKETRKEKPIDRRKIFETVIITLFSGLLFGVVAATTFIITEYGWENTVLASKDKKITIATAEASNDTDAALQDTEAKESSAEKNNSSRMRDDSSAQYYEIAQKAGKSIVQVAAASSNIDIFSSEYESTEMSSGLIIADNNKELFVLVDGSVIDEAEEIRVIFANEKTVPAILKASDTNINLAVVAISLTDIDNETRSNIEVAQFATAHDALKLGDSVIAVGSPLGIADSFLYGYITSVSKQIPLQDNEVHILTTDIYGSTEGSGILVNTQGQIAGIITHDYLDPSIENLVIAYNVADVKNTIEKMVNGQARARLGIYGQTVTKEVMEQLSIPKGVYVTQIEMDSPAMNNGIQVGDVITMIGTQPVESFNDYKDILSGIRPGDSAVITISRYSRSGYKEMTIDVSFDDLK